MKAVFFTSNNARMFEFQDIRDLPNSPNVIVNPDLSLVQGTPPHYWKINGNQIVPMNDPEKAERDAHIARMGVDNKVDPTTPNTLPQKTAFDDLASDMMIRRNELIMHMDQQFKRYFNGLGAFMLMLFALYMVIVFFSGK